MTYSETFTRYSENVEKIFIDDVREKKRAGRGAFAMRGKGVKHGISGALRTPYHFMTAKEKKKLNGEVKVKNMYETIIPHSEFELKDEETQKLMLTRWREIYSNKKIRDELGIANSPYYKLVDKLNLPKKARKPLGSAKVDTKKKTTDREKSIAIETQPNLLETREAETMKQQETVKQMVISKGLNLEYFGEYDVDTLTKLFTKLQLLLDGEENKYHIRLSLSEISNEDYNT